MTNHAPILRHATAADADAISALFTELEHPTPVADIPARLDALVGEGGAALLATSDEGEPLGLMTLGTMITLHNRGPVAHITALVITAAARGQGVGRALVDEAWRWARRRGCARLVVASHLHRAGAHAFYESCGLPRSGIRFSAPVPPEG